MRHLLLAVLLVAVVGCGPDTKPEDQPASPAGSAGPPAPADTNPVPGDAKPETEFSNSIGMKLKLIPSGEFLMGSPSDEKNVSSNEQPQHKVRLTESFYLGAYEVTQGDYEAVMGTNPSRFSKTGSGKDQVAGKDTRQFPVENVTWYDAVEFCNKLSSKEGLTPCYRLTGVKRDGRISRATVSLLKGMGYRLPTEAEWEYACRAGTTTKYSFGNSESELGDYAWYAKGGKTHPVGKKKQNAWGLYDMHGNVYEWCQDVYDSKAYESRSGITQNPLSTSGSGYRVLRGGSGLDGWDARSAYRTGGTPGYRNYLFGFRVVLSVGARTRNP